jgi:hypothetical protein
LRRGFLDARSAGFHLCPKELAVSSITVVSWIASLVELWVSIPSIAFVSVTPPSPFLRAAARVAVADTIIIQCSAPTPV